MNEYIIVSSEGLYKIYRKMNNSRCVYQYAGATFVMLVDAEDFIKMRSGDIDAA